MTYVTSHLIAIDSAAHDTLIAILRNPTQQIDSESVKHALRQILENAETDSILNLHVDDCGVPTIASANVMHSDVPYVVTMHDNETGEIVATRNSTIELTTRNLTEFRKQLRAKSPSHDARQDVTRVLEQLSAFVLTTSNTDELRIALLEAADALANIAERLNDLQAAKTGHTLAVAAQELSSTNNAITH